MTRVPAKVHRGPNLSQHGPAISRTNMVAQRAMMFELATSILVNFRSFCIVSCRSGGKAYHDQKATKKPNQLKKNTRPYMLMTLKNGIDRAFPFIGLTSGALKSTVGLNILLDVKVVLLDRLDRTSSPLREERINKLSRQTFDRDIRSDIDIATANIPRDTTITFTKSIDMTFLRFSGDSICASSRPKRPREGKSAADHFERSGIAERISTGTYASHFSSLPRVDLIREEMGLGVPLTYRIWGG